MPEDRPQMIFEVVKVERTNRGKNVTLEGRVPSVMPDIVARNRARLRAISVSGLVDPSVEFAQDLADGNLGRLTSLRDESTLEEDMLSDLKRWEITVNTD